MPGMCAYQPSKLCECCAASCLPPPVAMRITSGQLNCPPDMCSHVAALFTIWSSGSRLKLHVITSTIGRMPPIAAPMPAPTKPDSESGVSRMRSGPNSSSMPRAHGEAAAVAAHVFAHQKRARPAASRRGSFAHGLAVSHRTQLRAHGVFLRMDESREVCHRLPGAGLGEVDGFATSRSMSRVMD